MFQIETRFVYLIAFIATILLSSTLTNALRTSANWNSGLHASILIKDRIEQISQTHESTKPLQPRAAHHCGFTGNNDIYGIGIRIGIYTQALAVWFAKYFLASEAPFLRDSITVFTVALFIVSILYAAVNAAEIYAVEAFIILQIFAWQCLTGARTQSPHAKENFRNSVTRRVFTECMDIGCQSLLVWFWFRGIDEMVETPCGTFVFFLAKLDMFGGFRTYAKVVPVVAMLGHVHRIGLEAVNVRSYFMFQKAKRGFLETVARFEELERQKRERREAGVVTTMDHHRTSGDALTTESLDEGGDAPNQDTHRPALYSPSRRTSQDSETPISPVYSRPQEQAHTQAAATPLQTGDFRVFEDVYHGSLYLTRCMAATKSATLSGRSARLYKLYMRLPLGHRAQVTEAPQFCSSEALDIASRIPSFFACHRHVLKYQLTLRFPRRVAVLFTHLSRANLVDDWNIPYHLYVALTYPDFLRPETYAPLPSHEGTAVAAAILLPKAPKRGWTLAESWCFTISHLWIHVFFILQLELTIRWNRIEGLTGLASVGQLIPFVIGVGSLGLVLVRWVERWYKGEVWLLERGLVEDGVEGEGNGGSGKGRLDPEVVRVYERWKEEFEAEIRRLGTEAEKRGVVDEGMVDVVEMPPRNS
ncbi:hypothetical protein BU16DRAFT_562201 [Lophium mytilinum]|uniref:Uncharacterized protein n=1 Tax=Lophium mytilinum TaxID=390894 RepID=A0A6A6QQU9_9PEZI|nr:hypothetical protein BU16DRAFT_562201 [Lophium mytilinum]